MEHRPERRTTPSAYLRMQGCMLSTMMPPGALLGLETVAACMKDEVLRPFLGHALLHEIMPCMGLSKQAVEALAMQICRELETSSIEQPLVSLAANGVRAWGDQVLPLLTAYQEREDAIPPCLCLGLAALIMLFAGARQGPDGAFASAQGEKGFPLTEDEDILRAFSRLSCDMPPETLAYAVLSDRAIWERDLREIPGLEEKLAGQLRDLQLIGLRAALESASRPEG